MRFDNCFAVNSICTPSRATILTGKYSHLNGVPIFNRFDGSQPTVAKYLQAAGYYTGMIGKWHLGSDPTGFDYWTILPGQGVYFDPVFLDADGRRVIKGYVTDIITDLAIDFLKNRPKDKPFFLMCHHKAPHRPWEPDEKHRAMFADKHIPEPATLRDDYATRTDAIRECTQKVFDDLTRRDLKLVPPADLTGASSATSGSTSSRPRSRPSWTARSRQLTGDALNAWKYQRYMQDYLACVQSVDDNVGRLLDWLDQNGLRDNTVVIYTSDQGFFLGDHGLFDKRFMYEESIKMPFIVRWPGVIKPGTRAGGHGHQSRFRADLHGHRRAAGAGRHAGPQPGAAAQGPAPGGLAHELCTTATTTIPATTTPAPITASAPPTHKLIYFWKKDQWEMYDLVKDPDELHNLYQRPRAAGHRRPAEERALPPEERGQGRRPIRQRTAAARRRCATGRQAQAEAALRRVKSETRRPKAERRPKPEIRNHGPDCLSGRGSPVSVLARQTPPKPGRPTAAHSPIIASPFRASDFGLLSAFGLRISDFPAGFLSPASPPCPSPPIPAPSGTSPPTSARLHRSRNAAARPGPRRSGSPAHPPAHRPRR